MRPLTPPPHPSLGIWQAIIVPPTPHTINKCLKFLCILPYLSHACRSRYAPSCLTLCDPVDCSPPGSSVHGIFQARILEWVAISFSRGSSWPRDRTQVSRIAGSSNIWATREAHGRKWRETKKPLDENEREEWKIWLKAQHSENKDHGIWSHHFLGNRWGNSGNSVRLYFGGLQNHCRWWLQPWN